MATVEGWNIPEDLITSEILTWLPVKSLRRFQSVCKAWHSEISNRHFIELHRERSQPNICKLVGSCTGDIKIERLTEEGDLQQYYMLPWVDDRGLVTSSRHLIVLSYEYGYLLSNPAMRDIFYIPHDPWDEADIHLTGFGFVSSLGKYKVVSIILGSEDICEVFTVGIDNSWRKGKSPRFRISASFHMPYLNGNLHMLSSECTFFEESKDGDGRALLFNLEEEAWSVMALPDVQKMDSMAFELREMRGSLCFICRNPEKRIDLWMLRDYASNVWSKDFVIDVTHLQVINSNWLLFGFPLEVMTDGRIFLEMEDDHWLYYDPQNGSFQLVGHKGVSNTVYSENLVPILGF
ncbi:F-box protein At3g07870-like [Phragmites australis]|uniref:F-box protein At3g07870-like n=1 Tax=Phragmites australis TaxID=29695 RepID=UPI002D780DDF|nr:F-box protein At3g07870-like [Phragmites australis]